MGIIHFAYIARSLVKGSKSAAKFVPQWSKECAPYLVSAITGGQWTQARKAAVKSWNPTNLCQLCQEEVGTIPHRFTCKSSAPAGGWPQPPPEASHALAKLDPRQVELLKLRGVLAVQVKIPDRPADGFFEWVRQPCESLPDGSER